MKHYFFIKTVVLFVATFTLFSCDKEFNTLNSDLLEDNHFTFTDESVKVKTITQKTKAVQTNNLPINALGVYENPVFGTTKAHFVTQVALATENPTIGYNVDIETNDSVYLYIPYFSRADDSDATKYVLDSIHGNRETSIDLKIYKNNYLLRNLDPNPDPSDGSTYFQKYYSDEKSLIETGNLGNQLNTSTNTAENTQFKFTTDKYIFYRRNAAGEFINNSGTVVTNVSDRVTLETLTPGMWINLNKAEFKSMLTNATSSNLLNNNLFREYFRGLYFKAEQNPGQKGAMAMLDFSKGYIVLQYHSTIDVKGTDGVTSPVRTKKNIRLNLKGNTVNFFENNFSNDYSTALNTPNAQNKLFLKGGDGSMVFIDLFDNDVDAIKIVKNSDGTYSEAVGSNGVADQLDKMRLDGRLINEAHLVFHIDDALMGAVAKEPRRLYLYDATNNTTLLDYLDGSTGKTSKENKMIFNGIMNFVNTPSQKDERGTTYKIRLTDHLNRIIKNGGNTADKSKDNFPNVRLGLSVTENINIATNSYLKTTPSNVKFVPTGHVMNPLGTILHGAEAADPNKQLKLRIYYTKPN
jgi:hypothetical protein